MTEEFRLPPRVGSYVRLTGGENAGRSFRVQSIDSEGHCHLLPLGADADFRMRVPASEVVVITEQEMIENGGETAAEAGFRAERAARRVLERRVADLEQEREAITHDASTATEQVARQQADSEHRTRKGRYGQQKRINQGEGVGRTHGSHTSRSRIETWNAPPPPLHQPKRNESASSGGSTL